jgi:hypothetical protein
MGRDSDRHMKAITTAPIIIRTGEAVMAKVSGAELKIDMTRSFLKGSPRGNFFAKKFPLGTSYLPFKNSR